MLAGELIGNYMTYNTYVAYHILNSTKLINRPRLGLLQ